MKLKLKLLTAVLAMGVAGLASASSGVFGSYLAIDADGAGANPLTWYGAQQPGGNYLTDLDSLDLGIYTQGSQAFIAGAEVLTFKNNGSDVFSANLFWRVDGNAWQQVNIGFTTNSPFADAASNNFSGAGDQKWAQLANTSINFLNGAALGDHTLEVYYTAVTSDGIRVSNNSERNYLAAFTVVSAVPEPATWLSLSMGLLAVGAMRLRKRQD